MNEDKIQFRFIKLYTFSFCKELNPVETVILSLFFEKLKTEGKTQKSVSDLIKIIPFRTTERSVRKSLHRLQELQLISIEKSPGRGRSNRYSVNIKRIISVLRFWNESTIHKMLLSRGFQDGKIVDIRIFSHILVHFMV